MIAGARLLAAERAFRHQNLGRDLMRPNEPEPMLFENFGDPGEQMIVPAAEDLEHGRQQPQRLDVRPDTPDRRPHHGADEDHIAAALAASDPAEPAELPKGGPV